MINRNSKSSGFVIILTMMVIALLTSLATYLSHRTTIFYSYASVAIKREQAKLLALSGIQIAMSQLIYPGEQEEGKSEQKEESKEDKEKKKKKQPQSDDKPLLAKILPSLNRWQVYKLNEEVEGVDGIIKVCISSEDGKININQLYDFENHEFIEASGSEFNVKEAIENIFSRIESELGIEDLFAQFESFLKEQSEPLEDISQLLAADGFKAFKNQMFYEPPSETTTEKKRGIYLADLFTVWPATWGIEPWLFSDSLLFILGIKQATSVDSGERKESVEKWLEQFKSNAQWRSEWDTVLKPVYQKEFSSLPKGIDFILRRRFIPSYFSILVRGEFESVSQQMLAIVQRVRVSSKGSEAPKFDVKIRKLYWI